jgi:hypothetical protein
MLHRVLLVEERRIGGAGNAARKRKEADAGGVDQEVRDLRQLAAEIAQIARSLELFDDA